MSLIKASSESPVHSSTTAVECRGIVKTFQTGLTEVHALRGVDLSISTGEFFMLVGPSGCGKTTLISVIAGILTHDEGECLVFGKNLKNMSDYERTTYRGGHIGFVFQSYNLIPSLRINENVAIPLIINGSPQREALEAANVVLEQVGLAEKIQALPTELSGGQQQRVAIARALVHNPQLIVCDEPTAALDHDTGTKVMELFRRVAVTENRALVVVTHDARIFSYADRIAKLDDGKVTKIVTSVEEL